MTTASALQTRPHPLRGSDCDPEAPSGLRVLEGEPALGADVLADLTAAPSAPLELGSSDEQLAVRVATDGQAPFAVLYERHRVALDRYCLSVVREHEDAADAAHEAWLRAFVALRSPEMRPISFRAWLYSIARNACVDRLRDRGRFSLNELGDDDLGHGDSVVDTHETRESVRMLLVDLATLSERQRSAIALREVAGLSLDEIAVALQTTPPKVMSLIAEARRVLHERESGRRLSCDAVRARIDVLRVQGHCVRAHLDDCAACRAHHATTRGRRLSSLGVVPLGFLRPVLDRIAVLTRHTTGWDSFTAKVAAAGAAALVAGTGLAVHGGLGQHAAPRARVSQHAAGAPSALAAATIRFQSGPRSSHAAPADRHGKTVATAPPSPAATDVNSALPRGSSGANSTAQPPAIAPPSITSPATDALAGPGRQLGAQQLKTIGRNTTATVHHAVQSIGSATTQVVNQTAAAAQGVIAKPHL